MSELDILNEGRRAVAVVFKDGSKGEVTVKKVGLVDMPRLARARRDDQQLAALYLDAPEPQAVLARLTDESLLDLLNEGDAVNDPLLNRWLEREENKLRKLGIDLAELHATVLEKVADQEAASAATSETSSTSSPVPDTAPSRP